MTHNAFVFTLGEWPLARCLTQALPLPPDWLHRPCYFRSAALRTTLFERHQEGALDPVYGPRAHAILRLLYWCFAKDPVVVKRELAGADGASMRRGFHESASMSQMIRCFKDDGYKVTRMMTFVKRRRPRKRSSLEESRARVTAMFEGFTTPEFAALQTYVLDGGARLPGLPTRCEELPFFYPRCSSDRWNAVDKRLFELACACGQAHKCMSFQDRWDEGVLDRHGGLCQLMREYNLDEAAILRATLEKTYSFVTGLGSPSFYVLSRSSTLREMIDAIRATEDFQRNAGFRLRRIARCFLNANHELMNDKLAELIGSGAFDGVFPGEPMAELVRRDAKRYAPVVQARLPALRTMTPPTHWYRVAAALAEHAPGAFRRELDDATRALLANGDAIPWLTNDSDHLEVFDLTCRQNLGVALGWLLAWLDGYPSKSNALPRYLATLDEHMPDQPPRDGLMALARVSAKIRNDTRRRLLNEFLGRLGVTSGQPDDAALQ